MPSPQGRRRPCGRKGSKSDGTRLRGAPARRARGAGGARPKVIYQSVVFSSELPLGRPLGGGCAKRGRSPARSRRHGPAALQSAAIGGSLGPPGPPGRGGGGAKAGEWGAVGGVGGTRDRAVHTSAQRSRAPRPEGARAGSRAPRPGGGAGGATAAGGAAPRECRAAAGAGRAAGGAALVCRGAASAGARHHTEVA
ncbi:MAG: hypothetical protein J3K34DRAFT_64146 [Monoraphidium minutum]|nr:MAG: hypothetical protein J3K34DRAFT_64146 [Monoraphidium minutum]